MGGCWGGGSGFALPAAALQLLELFAGRQPVSIGWEERGALQAANRALRSKYSEILIRGSNGLNFCSRRGGDMTGGGGGVDCPEDL